MPDGGVRRARRFSNGCCRDAREGERAEDCKDIEYERVAVPSADLKVAPLQLPDASVLLASVYVEGSNVAALSRTMRLLDDAIITAHCRSGPRLDVVVAGDFSRHDQL